MSRRWFHSWPAVAPGEVAAYAAPQAGRPAVHRGWALALWLAGAGSGIAACIYLYHHDPSRPSLLPPCLFHKLTGLDCPGCGATRAAWHALHGHFYTALTFNPLLVLLVPILLWAAARAFARDVLGRPGRGAPVPWWSGYVLLGIVVGFTVVRNLPAGRAAQSPQHMEYRAPVTSVP